jgi:hypothetical protein
MKTAMRGIFLGPLMAKASHKLKIGLRLDKLKASGTPAAHARRQGQFDQNVRLSQNHPHNLKVIASPEGHSFKSYARNPKIAVRSAAPYHLAKYSWKFKAFWAFVVYGRMA